MTKLSCQINFNLLPQAVITIYAIKGVMVYYSSIISLFLQR